MTDKLARAQHIRVYRPEPTAREFAYQSDDASQRKITTQLREGIRESKTKSDVAISKKASPATTSISVPAPGSTGALFVGGRHAGVDRTAVANNVSYQETAPSQQRTLTHSISSASTPERKTHSSTARHNATSSSSTSPVSNAHTNIPERTAHAAPVKHPIDATSPAPGSTGAIFVGGRHAGVDRTLSDMRTAPLASSNGPTGSATSDKPTGNATSVGSSAALISVCVLISRITGFGRTWAMAFALGSTLLSSSFQVANNLPNTLYELVVGGMLVTAFLPVYLSVKKRLGTQASNEYASNLLTIVVILLGVVTAVCLMFPSAVIFTQSFYSNQAEMTTSVFFFQFFAVQIVFYGVGAIVSGLLNANRDFLWSSIAPVANNIIVIAAFLLYAALASHNQTLALYVLAIGNSLGVFVQMAIQIPALKRNGIRLRPRVNFHDPALRETLGIGAPAVLVMLCSFVVVSVENAASYSFAVYGPSVLAYSRLWFMLPYSLLAVPITTAMFTELSDMRAEGNAEGVKRGIISGTSQILFFMIPFALYLVVFALPLITLYNAGAFTMESVTQIASYLSVYAFALPFYAVNTYLQKIFSSLRKMGVYAGFNLLSGVVQVAIIAFAASYGSFFSIEIIAVTEILFFAMADICLFAFLRRRLGAFGLRSVARAILTAVVLGGIGAAAGWIVLQGLFIFVAPLSGSILQAFAYVVVGGVVSMVVTFGIAVRQHVPEAAFVVTIAHKIANRIRKHHS